MALVAPLSRYKKNTCLIWMVVCIGFGGWFAYDGYFSKAFIDKHTPDGRPDSTLAFNQKSPPFFIGAAVLMGAYLFVIRNRKIVAEENDLVVDGKLRIPYDSVQKIDKTWFDSKGHFTIGYAGADGKETTCKLSDRNYDNLGPVLEHLVAKMS